MISQRIDYVDVSRGVLILLMFAVHAATPCTISIRDSIQGLWVLEIATTGFAMMAGYTVGIRYSANTTLPQPRRLWKRCGELLIVMFWSNALLGVAKLYITHQPDVALFVSWFLGLFTFRTEYNISGVLLPIALLLPILPWIYAMEKRVGKLAGLVWFGVIIGLMVWLNRFTLENEVFERVRSILLIGLGGFSVLVFLAYGILGYVNARVLQECQRMGWSLGAAVIAGIAFSSVLFVAMESLVVESVFGLMITAGEQTLLPFVRSEVMFLGVIALSALLTSLWPGSPIVTLLRLLGTYALCAFVFHRFVGQGLMTSLHLQGGEIGTFLLMLGAITVSTYFLCVARLSKGSLDVGLKRLFL